MPGPPRSSPQSRPAMSPVHVASITLGLVAGAIAIFVSGYWAIGLGVVGAAMATSPARAGTDGAGRPHMPAFAVCVFAALLGAGAVFFGFAVRGSR